MKKVFIPNRSSHDYSRAKRFGTLITLTKGNIDLNNTSKIYRLVEDALVNSSPDDYIMISGPSILNAIVCSMFTQLHGKINYLIYRRDGSYIERNMSFKNLTKREKPE